MDMTGPGPRILIVDDEEPMLVSLATAAESRGYAAETAQDGSQALDIIRRAPFDLVVTDLRMPGLAGAALMGRIREEGFPTRVVVITGYASLEAAIDCLRMGAMDFLVKPFAIETFLETVAKVLSRPTPAYQAGPNWKALGRRYQLTPREREVLEAYYETGKSNRELAEELCIAPETVKSHLKFAFQKLGVSNRTQFFRMIRATRL